MATLGFVWLTTSLPSLCRTNCRVFSVISVAGAGANNSGTEFGGPDVATSCLVVTTVDFEVTSRREFTDAACSPLER